MNATEFKQLLLPLNARLYKVAFLLLGNEDDAKDVVQDAYLKLWNQREKLNNLEYFLRRFGTLKELANHMLFIEKKMYLLKDLTAH